jgi:hypothetical protein
MDVDRHRFEGGMDIFRHLAIVAVAATTLSAPAYAQYGRLTPPDALIGLFSRACVAGAPRFSTFLPTLAKRERWDQLGLSASAKPGDQGWLVSVGGQPAIVDIHRPTPTTETCSVSAVTAPGGLVQAMTRRQKRAPDIQRNQAGGLVKGWSRTIEGRPVSITVPTDGRAMARITLTASR